MYKLIHNRKNILFLFLFVLNFLKSQDHGFFNQIWLDQGLSQSSIVSIIRDRQGFMWFATQDGLNRYDGRNMDHFNFKPFDKQSISGDDIYSVCLDSNELFVLNDKGLDKIDLNSLKITNLKRKKTNDAKLFFKCWMLNHTLYLFNRDGLAKAKVLPDAEFEYEYCRFSDSTKRFNKISISSLCADEKGNIFAATNNGIYEKKIGNEDFVQIFKGTVLSKFKKENDSVFTSITWKDNKLVFTNSSALLSLDLKTMKVNSLMLRPYSPLSSILIDKQGKIWIGTGGNGLLVISGKGSDSLFIDKYFSKNNNSRYTLQSNEITSLYQDPGSQNDIIWIGTRDAGAFSFSYFKNSFYVPTSFVNSSDKNFFGVVKDKSGIIWTGCASGILRIDEANKSYQTIELAELFPKSNRPVQALCCDWEDNIWVAYGNSLLKIDKKKCKPLLITDHLAAEKNNQSSRIVELSRKELLICTARGIVVFNKVTNAIRCINSINIDNQKVNLENTESFIANAKGDWWIGSTSGLYCIRKNGSNIALKHNNSDSNSILSNRVMDINETDSGELIVATTKGLSLIRNYGKQIRNIYSAKGLSNNFAYGLLKDNSGRFWISTNYGISVFDPIKMEFKSYTASDGICINEFNSGGFYKTDNGELIFAGLGGLVSVHPEYQVINKSVAAIILRTLKIENYKDSIDTRNVLDLSYGQNNIYLEFSVPDYSGQKNMNLFYRFKNKDTTWTRVNPSQLFSLSFIDLAPGSYNLEVVAVNNEGARSNPFMLFFKIGDPFWSTWWFYLILICLSGFISWVVYRARLKRKIAYIEQIEQVRKDENEKVRKAAALDLHDEFGNGLTRISMLIEMIKIHIVKENGEAHKLLDVISQNSNRLYHGTKDFIWSINPGKDNFYEIAIRIKDYADELFYGTQTTFVLEGLKDEFTQLRQSPTSGRNIAMIFKESLSNVLKHAKAEKVVFSLKQDGGHIYLILEDNGIGFEMKDKKNSFGITNIQQRATRLDADLEIASTLNKGTRIALAINLKSRENERKA